MSNKKIAKNDSNKWCQNNGGCHSVGVSDLTILAMSLCVQPRGTCYY